MKTLFVIRKIALYYALPLMSVLIFSLQEIRIFWNHQLLIPE